MADNSFKKPISDNQNSSSLEQNDIENGNTSTFSQKIKGAFSSSNQDSISDSLVNLLSAIGIWILVVLLGVSFVSFIFTGEADQSLVLGFFSETPSQDTPQNWLGMFGAVCSHFLIERWFGVGAFLLLVIGATFGLVLIKKYDLDKWKELSLSLFFVIFVMSCLLGYLVYVTETQTAWAFLCGGIGYAISALFGVIFTPIFIIVTLLGFGYFFGKERLNIELYTNFSSKEEKKREAEQRKQASIQNLVPSAKIDAFKEIEASKANVRIENEVEDDVSRKL